MKKIDIQVGDLFHFRAPDSLYLVTGAQPRDQGFDLIIVNDPLVTNVVYFWEKKVLEDLILSFPEEIKHIKGQR